MSNWEKCLIGTILADPASIQEVPDLTPQDFESQQHQTLWKHIIQLSARDGLSPRGLVESLRTSGELEDIGDAEHRGEDYIKELIYFADLTALSEFAFRVRDASVKRRLIKLCAYTATEAKNGTPSDEILEEHIRNILKLRTATTRSIKPIGAVLPEFNDKFERLKNNKIFPYWRPNITAVREIIRYMEDVDFMLIVGKPGSGKSSLLRYEGLKTALQGIPVLTLTFENSAEEYLSWALAFLANVDRCHIVDPTLLMNREAERLEEAKQEIATIPWYIEEMGLCNFANLARVVRTFALQNSIKLIQVDGMYLLTGNNESKYELITENTQGLRSLAQELHVPIQATTQFSRGVHLRKEPTMSDLLYAGENAARQILAIVQEPMDPSEAILFPENIDENGKLMTSSYRAVVIQVNVLKNTGGRTGKSGDN